MKLFRLPVAAAVAVAAVLATAGPGLAFDCIRVSSSLQGLQASTRSGNWLLFDLSSVEGVQRTFETIGEPVPSAAEAQCLVTAYAASGQPRYFALGIGVAGPHGVLAWMNGDCSDGRRPRHRPPRGLGRAAGLPVSRRSVRVNDGEHEMRIFVRSIAMLFGALVFGVAAANATVIEQQQYADVESFTLDGCGFTLEGVAETSGHLLFRVDQTGQVFLAKDAYRFQTTLTNRDTRRSFFLRGQGLYHEIAATPLGGTLYEISAVEAGVPFTIVDSTGRVVLRDRGAIRIDLCLR